MLISRCQNNYISDLVIHVGIRELPTGGQHQGRAFRDQIAGRCPTPKLFKRHCNFSYNAIVNMNIDVILLLRKLKSSSYPVRNWRRRN
jgi:hypothetical protein